MGAGDVDAHLRPTSDRTRETLFNMLSHTRYAGLPQNANVIDLFAGTGALGLEALSRGARACTFVENGKVSAKLLRKNINTLGAEAQIKEQDALSLPPHDGEKFDLTFLDPPYSKALGEGTIPQLISGQYLSQDAVIIWEEERPPNAPTNLQKIDMRKVGRTYLNFFRYKETS